MPLGDRFQELDEAGRTVMGLTFVDGPVDHARLIEATESHSRDLTLLLQSLLRKHLLERVGHGRGCSYQIPSGEIHALDELPDPRDSIEDV